MTESATAMDPRRTALILIGFQNDYFDPQGLVHGALENSDRVREVCERTMAMVERLSRTPTLIIATPIRFTEDYSELVNPVGILRVIKDVGAFRGDRDGGRTIAPLLAFGDRVLEVPGKRGLNAFANTQLDDVLRAHEIEHVVIAGVVTSICVDSTGREAAELGYRVTMLADCTAGRSTFEQEFFCQEVFPLYASVARSQELTEELTRCTLRAPATS